MSDLISRQDVIGVLTRYRDSWQGDYYVPFQKALDEVNAMPTVEPEQQWIPCNERLPKNPKNVTDIKEYLTCDKDGNINKLMWGGGWNCVLYPDGSCCKDYEIKGIVAWMPLLEPYKGEQNDGRADGINYQKRGGNE